MNVLVTWFSLTLFQRTVRNVQNIRRQRQNDKRHFKIVFNTCSFYQHPLYTGLEQKTQLHHWDCLLFFTEERTKCSIGFAANSLSQQGSNKMNFNWYILGLQGGLILNKYRRREIEMHDQQVRRKLYFMGLWRGRGVCFPLFNQKRCLLAILTKCRES